VWSVVCCENLWNDERHRRQLKKREKSETNL
jgi:hypothetical protein